MRSTQKYNAPSARVRVAYLVTVFLILIIIVMTLDLYSTLERYSSIALERRLRLVGGESSSSLLPFAGVQNSEIT